MFLISAPFLQDFNPRSREGSDTSLSSVSCLMYVISIHAPAKGATVRHLMHLISLKISIHAPAKGATFEPLPFFVSHCYFNPRSREGSDIKPSASPTDSDISIHAPAKGATLNEMSSPFVDWISIHAPAKGATKRFRKEIMDDFIFQSTLPRRERPAVAKEYGKDCRGFQSTLPRRERLKCKRNHITHTNFNPRSREGSDHIRSLQLSKYLQNFNPRSREGSDGKKITV